MDISKKKIAIIGLGYVGLPLALAFGKKYKTFGFDIKKERVDSLINFNDQNNEFDKNSFKKSKLLTFSYNQNEIKNCNVFIICVPTPVYKNKKPNLSLLIKATELVAKFVKKNDLVIYESTVFPGCTEEICGKLIEVQSKMQINKDFFLGYSPERINPGDKQNKLENIVKVTSGSNKNSSKLIEKLYRSIIPAGVYSAKSIKIAESAKIIENIQRDVNIALMNEFKTIFDKMNLNTYDIIDTASTKWNFLKFKPGMVGGHCIGVDPYYLSYKSRQLRIKANLITSGRKINELMYLYYARAFITYLKVNNLKLYSSRVLILGMTFKENCSDTRNSQVLKLAKYLLNKKVKVHTFDPLVKRQLFNDLLKNDNPKKDFYDYIIIAVNHKKFKKLGFKKISNFGNKNVKVFDLKNLFPNEKLVIKL